MNKNFPQDILSPGASAFPYFPIVPLLHPNLSHQIILLATLNLQAHMFKKNQAVD